MYAVITGASGGFGRDLLFSWQKEAIIYVFVQKQHKATGS